MHNWAEHGKLHLKLIDHIKVLLLLVIVFFCLFEYVLQFQSNTFKEFENVVLQTQRTLVIFLAIWCGCFLLLTYSLNDLPLLGLLLIAVAVYFIDFAICWRDLDAIVFLAGVTMGKGTNFLLKMEGGKQKSGNFIVGLVVLLFFSSWWHLDMAGTYHGPRWMGLWNNPNVYGMFMGLGLLIAIALLAQRQKEEFRMKKLLPVTLLVSAGMMVVCLVFSYSRGAWLGTAVGLLYLAKAHGKFNCKHILPGIFVVTTIVALFWNVTPDNAPWFLKRLDLSRPSAQHRVSAWRGALQMMWDYPLGVGWNQAVGTYEKKYSPPEGGAAAITTNDYLMLGTQLGLPALLCFIAYIYLKFKAKAADSLQVACRAGALVLLVAFWFDGGLFNLPTAVVFWILLELGSASPRSLAPTKV